MSGTPAETFEEAACRAARRAGELLRERFRRTAGMRIDEKARHDFVTDADREAEAAVVGYLRDRFPDHVFVAEESHGAERVPGFGEEHAAPAGYRWLVDPLDGTTNFIHGVPTFATSVALEDPQGLLAAAVYDPVHDETIHAARGRGTKVDGRPVRCSMRDGLAGALVATGIPFHDLSLLPDYLRSFEAITRASSRLRRAGAAALDLAFTACGRYDGFWEVGLRPWDLAAGALLVREAGGVVTDLLGGDTFLDSGGIVAAGPAVHAALVAITRRAFGST